MDALRGSRGDDKIPRRLEDPRGTEGLPESDIEFASWRPAHYPPKCGSVGPQPRPYPARPAHYAFFIESTGAYP